ncbi:hypothetical protein ACPDZI_08555 [Aeromonas oralensis]|uniref:hypothetical protein n=1 Tax=Aeromonas oralensis TaxID=3415010 RepID=UPI003D3A92D0
MIKRLLLSLTISASCNALATTVPSGKIEPPFKIGNEVVCLKEVQQHMTPFLKNFEQESGVQYKYIVKSGLSYNEMAGLRLQINRVDSGLNVRVADMDYYWLQERGSMCQPSYLVLDRSES